MTESISVTHVVLSLDFGGLERVVLDLVRVGQSLGQRVSVVCLERPGTLAPQVEELGAKVICVKKPPGLRPGIITSIRRVFEELRPDVVHTHQVAALLYAGPAARRAGVPAIVHTEHGKNYSSRLRTRWVGRLAGRYAGRFFCVSRDIAGEVLACRVARRKKVLVVPNGIDPARFGECESSDSVRQSLGISLSAPVIGTMGRLTEIKRQDLLISAFAKVRAVLREARLLVVGDGPLIGALRQQAGTLGVEKFVYFLGYQSNPARFLKAMNVFALTSRSEGMPLVVLEAWAAGVPVVASRVGGLPEMVEQGRTGMLFDSGDVDGLADALTTLLKSPEVAHGMGETGRQRVESIYHVRTMTENYHRHYLELLEQSAARPRA